MPMTDEEKKNVEDKVDAAVDLKRTIDQLTERLDLLKADLRLAAVAGAFPVNDKGNTLIRSRATDNCATVCQVDDKPAFIKDAVRIDLEERLPSPVFNGLFEREIVLGDEFKTAFPKLPKAYQAIVKQYVEWKPQDARVNLSK